jgi:hypothetical protein
MQAPVRIKAALPSRKAGPGSRNVVLRSGDPFGVLPLLVAQFRRAACQERPAGDGVVGRVKGSRCQGAVNEPPHVAFRSGSGGEDDPQRNHVPFPGPAGVVCGKRAWRRMFRTPAQRGGDGGTRRGRIGSGASHQQGGGVHIKSVHSVDPFAPGPCGLPFPGCRFCTPATRRSCTCSPPFLQPAAPAIRRSSSNAAEGPPVESLPLLHRQGVRPSLCSFQPRGCGALASCASWGMPRT